MSSDTVVIVRIGSQDSAQMHLALLVTPDSFLTFRRAEITSLAARYRLPAVYPFRYFTKIDGLLYYGSDLLDVMRRAAAYTDRILRGEKPSELAVQNPVEFDLVVNVKAAKEFGIDVPTTLLARTDDVVEYSERSACPIRLPARQVFRKKMLRARAVACREMYPRIAARRATMNLKIRISFNVMRKKKRSVKLPSVMILRHEWLLELQPVCCCARILS